MTEPVTALGSADPASGAVQPNNNGSRFQGAVTAAKANLWHFDRSASAAEDHFEDANSSGGISVFGYHASTSGDLTAKGAEVKASGDVHGMDLQAVKVHGDAGSYGVAGSAEVKERVGVLEAGANLKVDLRDVGASGGVKLGAIGGDIVGKASGGIYPSRWIGTLCDGIDGRHSQIPIVPETCEAVAKSDYGIRYDGQFGGTAGVAFAAEAGVSLGLQNGHGELHYKLGISPGVGLVHGQGISYGRFDKSQ